MEISLAVLLIQTGKTNMTNNRDKIVKGKKKKIDMIFLPYRPPLLGTVLCGFDRPAQTALKSFSKIEFVFN